MIESIEFKNFKALRDAKLELGPFTLLIGPNGSGKSTVLEALMAVREPECYSFERLCNVRVPRGKDSDVAVTVTWSVPGGQAVSRTHWLSGGGAKCEILSAAATAWAEGDLFVRERLGSLRTYALQPRRIAVPVVLKPGMELHEDGYGLPAVLDGLRDAHPERFEALNEELGRWIPEFDRVLFETPETGHRAIRLRTRIGGHRLAAEDVSHGTLLALTILTLAYLPEPLSVVCLKEPDHGLHPRLLRHVRDAIYRLCYPDRFGEQREPAQVIATTHSPYMLDLFRNHPEEIVIAHKTEDNVVFERLSDRPDLEEILADTHLGDAWYSGILGGAPSEP